jgi:tripartite-type tricarboxylate transporter receptor subunit TctC
MATPRILMGRWLAVASLVLLATYSSAFAQSYPTRPVIMSVGFSAGGIADIVTRIISQPLSTFLGQPVVVENKPGADGRLQLQQLARTAPDGYSLGLADSGLAVNALLYSNSAYDPLKDFTPIIYLGEVPNFIAVTPSLNMNTLSEFIDYGKAHAGELNYAATASSTLLAAEMFKAAAGLNIVRVPYRGQAYGIPALLRGEVQLMVSAVGPLTPLVKQGKIKALAVTASKRTPLAPTIPTTTEAGLPAMVYVNWYCIVGPAGMPRPIVDRLNAELRKVLAEPKVVAQLRNMGIEPTSTSPEEFTAILKSEMAKIDKVITAGDLKIKE